MRSIRLIWCGSLPKTWSMVTRAHLRTFYCLISHKCPLYYFNVATMDVQKPQHLDHIMSVFLCVRRLCCHDLSHVALTSVRASGFRGLWGFLSGDSWGLYFSLTQHLFHINRNFIIFFNLQSSCPTTATLSCPCIVNDPQNSTGLLFLEPYSFFVILLALTSLSHSATLTGFIGLKKACVGRILIKVSLEVSV